MLSLATARQSVGDRGTPSRGGGGAGGQCQDRSRHVYIRPTVAAPALGLAGTGSHGSRSLQSFIEAAHARECPYTSVVAASTSAHSRPAQSSDRPIIRQAAAAVGPRAAGRVSAAARGSADRTVARQPPPSSSARRRY